MPKKGKKGAGKKGERMMKEEQLLQLHRAQAEQEMSRKKKMLALRDKLQREQRNSAVNEKKIKDNWRSILAQTKDPKLREQVEVAWQKFERQVDEQNAIIQKLMGEVEEKELQMEKMQCSHLQHMEHLYGQQNRQLGDLMEQWVRGMDDLSSNNSDGMMPKKGKKGAGKKGERMMKEEQLLQLHRAQAEQEMSRKKKMLALRDKLQREQRNSAVNEKKIKDNWRSILAQTKDPKLREQVEVARQNFERQVDEQNAIIQKLMGEVEGKELQMEKMQCSHLQHMEHLYGQQNRRLGDLMEQWVRGMDDLSSNNSDGMNQMLAEFQQRKGKLSDFTLKVENNNSNMEEKVQRQLEKNQAGLEALALCEDKDDKDSTSLQKSIDKYEQKKQESLQKSQELDELVAKECQQLSKDLRKIKRLQHQVEQLRMQSENHQKEQDQKVQDLKDQRDVMNFKCLQLQDHMGRTRGAAKKQLTELAVQGDAATKKLKAVIAKGEKILKLGEMCRKLEVRVGLSSSSSSEEQPKLQDRLNTALLHLESLRAYKKELVQENQQLQQQLQQQQQLASGSDSVAVTAGSLTPTVSGLRLPALRESHHGQSITKGSTGARQKRRTSKR